MAMRDVDVRRALHEQLNSRHDHDDMVIVDEFGICNGASRIDVAVVNGKLTGYEIKSAVDRLDRLPWQVDLYSQVLDEVTLVVASGHLDEATELVPAWWGITEARGSRATVSLHEVRSAAANPSPDAFSLARLLWREEALDILERYEIADGVRSKPRRDLWNRLAEQLDYEALVAAVSVAIKSRTGWPGPS